MAEKVIVVTNVWSGPGLAAAVLLSRRGFRVFGTVDEYVSTTEELPFTQIRLNRGDVEAVRETVAKLLGVAGGIDALVNISETYTIGALEELSEEQTNRHFADGEAMGTFLRVFPCGRLHILLPGCSICLRGILSWSFECDGAKERR